ncbi:NADP-dependent malic enzyme [Granulosicoccus antarcticus]|uniref:NADP-dependent malic enzyme n=1 Tax=Granulosicoccus antarcticus IMCC3135 TaxID=1192854 RepID=A0A2Z2NQR1_9GAMM|nr:NADP-dependent malic enzyme [Granulosicoccus antarcticus]ASJ73683.1 NADP-dependent malic enzyme [Granulosicoccus antarcticus IMCC3135]
MSEDHIRKEALDYHRLPTAGKISLAPTKALTTQHDLSLAYSPGVAYACTAIQEDPLLAAELTSRANLVAVITNGTAVLGLGNIGALASKPVMEGKGCLFKKFAGIDVFDIEVAETDPAKFVEVVAALEPTFGGINLEDIKAPECFYIEKELRKRMKIPVFHDDQHGTAIVTAAAVTNALQLVGKQIEDVRLVASGAGAAALACLNLLISMGLKRENVLLCDSRGVVYKGRDNVDESKAGYARDTHLRTLSEAIVEADIFLGLSKGGALKPEMLEQMAANPVILAMANPEPEIRPELAKQVRPDCMIGTGRSDYPNQVNNSLCFPFIFRGALDVGATEINEAMKVAAVKALAAIAQAETSEIVAQAYGEPTPPFGPDYLIPRAFDPRLITQISPAVAQAAMDTGVATKPISDMKAYRNQLSQFVYESSSPMQPVFLAAMNNPKRVIYAEGEDERVLRAAQVAVDEGLAQPLLIGRTDIISSRIERLGLRLREGVHYESVNVLDDPRYHEVWSEYYELCKRQGVTKEQAKEETRTRTTLIGCMLLQRGDADALLCGTTGHYAEHLGYVRKVIGRASGVNTFAELQMIVLSDRQLFICDTQVNDNPSAEQIAEIAILAADEVSRFGIVPSVALLSRSSFGSAEVASAQKMRDALTIIKLRRPDLEVDGEMRADQALSASIRERDFPDSTLTSNANVLVMPNVDAANITYNALRVVSSGVTMGGILLGAAKSVHIMSSSSTVRRIVNMTALASVDATAHGVLAE